MERIFYSFISFTIIYLFIVHATKLSEVQCFFLNPTDFHCMDKNNLHILQNVLFYVSQKKVGCKDKAIFEWLDIHLTEFVDVKFLFYLLFLTHFLYFVLPWYSL